MPTISPIVVRLCLGNQIKMSPLSVESHREIKIRHRLREIPCTRKTVRFLQRSWPAHIGEFIPAEWTGKRKVPVVSLSREASPFSDASSVLCAGSAAFSRLSAVKTTDFFGVPYAGHVKTLNALLLSRSRHQSNQTKDDLWAWQVLLLPLCRSVQSV